MGYTNVPAYQFETATVSPAPETLETVGIAETVFVDRMNSLENLMVVQIIGSAFIAGCLLVTLVMRWFHVH